jgi:hypothetical protein
MQRLGAACVSGGYDDATMTAAFSASAATVNCPGTIQTTDREFSLTTTPGATCLSFGTGNISGNGDAINALGYVTLDKSDDNAVYGGDVNELSGTPSLTSGLSGTFSFFIPTAPVGKIWTDFVIAFKTGQGNLDPDWAAFLLPNGVTSGSWSISGQQALSHANLYAKLADTPVNVIPLPAAGWLLLAGVGGLAAMRRKKAA